MKTGGYKSCGCGLKNWRKNGFGKIKRTHGKSRTPGYKTWYNMIARCYHTNAISYPHYGARGITVCDRWFKFENFISDMGERPIEMTLDRIDVNGNYEPSNCRWATSEQQYKNIRRRTTIDNWEDGELIEELVKRGYSVAIKK